MDNLKIEKKYLHKGDKINYPFQFWTIGDNILTQLMNLTKSHYGRGNSEMNSW